MITKAWMIILIMNTPGLTEGKVWEHLVSGSVFETHDQCLAAVKDTVENSVKPNPFTHDYVKSAFCVETYIKGRFMKPDPEDSEIKLGGSFMECIGPTGKMVLAETTNGNWAWQCLDYLCKEKK